MNKLNKGTEATRKFYESEGWKEADAGKLRDTDLFGVKEDGPIRKALHQLRYERILSQLKPGDFVELGCGANPTTLLRPAWHHYTGVDFSSEGLKHCEKKVDVPSEMVEADMTALPLPDESADTVFSAHALYHIDTKEGQAAALREAMRILRPGGTAVFVVANPYPLLFPIRLLKRVGALLPGTSRLKSGVLPYLPLPIWWFRQQLPPNASVSIYAMHSTWFNQNVSEHSFPGKLAWRLVAWIETQFPRLAAYLGNYVVFSVRKQD